MRRYITRLDSLEMMELSEYLAGKRPTAAQRALLAHADRMCPGVVRILPELLTGFCVVCDHLTHQRCTTCWKIICACCQLDHDQSDHTDVSG